jgi:hypothetical protein
MTPTAGATRMSLISSCVYFDQFHVGGVRKRNEVEQPDYGGTVCGHMERSSQTQALAFKVQFT